MNKNFAFSGYVIIKGPKLRKPKYKGWYVRIKYLFIEVDGFGETERGAIDNAVDKIRNRINKGNEKR